MRKLITIGVLTCCCTFTDSVDAQARFREPIVPPATSVSKQIINRESIPVILGPSKRFSTEPSALKPSLTQVVAQQSGTSFLPPPISRSESKANRQKSLDDLTDEEFQSRLRELQDQTQADGQPLIDQLDTEPNLSLEKPGRETIRQRYPDGKTHVLRQVMQDAAGNYYNDGAWRVYSRGGEVIAEGKFERNRMVGQWRRYHNAKSGGLFSTAPFNQYKGRFLSVASFTDGKLNGMWTIYDQNNQKVFEVSYTGGKRDGTATWWYPTATKMREATFDDGLLDGKVLEWNEEGKLTRREQFINGQRVVRHVSRYRPKRLSEEQFFLDGKLKLDGEDQWWEAKPASFSTFGQRTQHGPIRRWYENGQPKMRGQYKNNKRVGKFMWWHTNGSYKLVANYEVGQKSGMWTWWHDNGMKSIQGEYDGNEAIGVWTWWDENGRVTRQENFDKFSRDTNGTSGELTEPNPERGSTASADETIRDDSNNGGSHDDEPSADDKSESQIPLLIDTDTLEEIDPLENTSGNLPTELPKDYLDSAEE